MSILGTPTDVKYFFSILYNENDFTLDQVKELAQDKIGEVTLFHPKFNPLQEYYSKEMGMNLKRVILQSSISTKREELIALKLWATKFEQAHLNDNGGRKINIDIGFVAKEQVILATGKPYSHRTYLGQGVYADLVYIYQDKSFRKVPWTYPDYQHEEKVDFFNRNR